MAGEELLELVTIVFISSELYYAKEGGGGPTTKRLVIRENRRLDMSDFLKKSAWANFCEQVLLYKMRGLDNRSVWKLFYI